jgi:hypothetical protein
MNKNKVKYHLKKAEDGVQQKLLFICSGVGRK